MLHVDPTSSYWAGKNERENANRNCRIALKKWREIISLVPLNHLGCVDLFSFCVF